MQRFWPRGALAIAGVLLLVLVGVITWYMRGQSEPTPWTKPATVDGDVVRLSYLGSECMDDVDVDVDEDSEQVVITLRETIRASSCSDVGVPSNVDVRLDSPLGNRELVDGTCQMPEYANYNECRTNQPTVASGTP